MERRHDVHLDRTTACRGATTSTRTCRGTASVRTATRRTSCRTSTSPPAVRWCRTSCASSDRSATGACTPTCRCRTRRSVLDQTNITSGLGNVTWQANQNNRITGFYSRQRYSKPNRLLNLQTMTVPESTVDEEDMFDVAQGLWNSVLGKNLFLDARLRREQDSVPDLLQRRHQRVAHRQRDRHHLRQQHQPGGPAPQPLPGERHGAVLHGSGARRPARVQVRLRLRARDHAQRDARARTTCSCSTPAPAAASCRRTSRCSRRRRTTRPRSTCSRCSRRTATA